MSLKLPNTSLIIFADLNSQIQPTEELDQKRILREQKFWKKIAHVYDSWIDSAFKDQYNVFKSRLISSINLNDSILDIGSGTGTIALHLAKRCKKVTGIDIVPEMIQIANSKKANMEIDNVTFLNEDAYNLPFPDSSFDKIVCTSVLQTMKEPNKAIIEGKRVLKPGGEFISITYCYGDSGILEKLKLLKWIIIYGMPRYWINFTHNDLISHFESANLEIIESNDVWKKPCVHFIRCKKK